MRALSDYYDATIRYADQEIGRLIEAVRAIDRESLIVITSDHGDEFLEHGYLYHTNVAYEELIRVPLLMSFPDGFAAGTRVTDLVRHVDVLPTIADAIGISPPENIMGESLLPLLRGERRAEPVESYAQGPFNMSLNYGDWKVIYNDTLNTYSLYDLSSDPGETRDLWLEDPAMQAELRDRMEQYIDTAKEIERRASEDLDPDTLRRLKALGYL